MLKISLAQNVFPSYSDAPKWRVANVGKFRAQTTTFKFTKDTMICGELYSEVFIYTHSPIYIRSDSVKTIYKNYPDCNAPSFVLYDYSLNEGAIVDAEFSGQFTVLEVDSAMHFDIKRKRMLVNTYFGEMYWIEGIGSTFHPFYAAMGLIADGDQNYVLLCYHEDAEQYYQTDEHDGCMLEFQIPSDYLYLYTYPNPFQQEAYILIEMDEFREVFLEIYCSSGQLIETFYSPSNSFHQIEIGKNLTSNGVYFAKIRIEDSIFTKKLLKWKGN